MHLPYFQCKCLDVSYERLIDNATPLMGDFLQQ